MNEATKKFLQVCTKHRLTVVSIGVKTPLVKSSQTYPFNPSGSAFADPEGEDRFPRIWRVCREAGVDGPCGNTGQYQLTHDHDLEPGVYRRHHLNWRKLA